MSYKFWRNAAAITAITGSVGLAGYAVAAPNSQPVDFSGNSQNSGLHQGWEKGQRMGVQNNRFKQPLHTPEEREQIQQAIKDGNYEQWKSLVTVDGKLPIKFENITAENFAKFAEMHIAMEAKDFTKADALRLELGLPNMGPRRMGAGMGQGKMNRTPLHTPEEREQIQQAIKDGNYEQWKSLVTVDGKLPARFESITAENFSQFAEMHVAMENRDFQKVQELSKELGLKMGGPQFGAKHGLGNGRGNR